MLEKLSRGPREMRREGYLTPRMEFIRFEKEDVITTSGQYSAKNQSGYDVQGVYGIDCF